MDKIPKFKSEKEEREFWATHSSADYWEDMEECEDTFKHPKLKIHMPKNCPQYA